MMTTPLSPHDLTTPFPLNVPSVLVTVSFVCATAALLVILLMLLMVPVIVMLSAAPIVALISLNLVAHVLQSRLTTPLYAPSAHLVLSITHRF